MKTFLFAFLLNLLPVWGFCQAILGTYEQSTIVAPPKYRQSEEDVKITKDPQSTKKIWVSGLIPKQKFYALLDTKTEDGAVYSIPKQTVGDYTINVGCIVYDNEDERVLISLNNPKDCNSNVSASVGKGGVSAGDVKVGSNGTISAPGVKMDKEGIKVNTKDMYGSGITYIGEKAQ